MKLDGLVMGGVAVAALYFLTQSKAQVITKSVPFVVEKQVAVITPQANTRTTTTYNVNMPAPSVNIPTPSQAFTNKTEPKSVSEVKKVTGDKPTITQVGTTTVGSVPL